MRVWHLLVAAPAGLWLTAVACSGGGGTNAATSCTSKGSCPNDPAPTQSEVAQCNSTWNDPKCGSLFQVYVACALAQEKCTSAGTIDDAATKAAIGANCSGQIANYNACTTGGPTCGGAGQSCCTGATQCNGGCCDPATQRCVGFFQPCSTPGQRCSEPLCTACGEPGEPCCGGVLCDNGCCVDQGDAGTGDAGVCVTAGAACPGVREVCTFYPSGVRGYCEFCGTGSSPCCEGGVCDPSLTCTGGMCN